MSSTIGLNAVELEQYSRHLKLPGFGIEKQLRLKAAKVLLIGAGGLGCPMGLYLAASGVGTIGVVDFDRVDRSNLQRQVAHAVTDIGTSKVESLIAAMREINPLLTYHAHPHRLDEHNIADLIRQYDLVLDGSDNFATRYLLADACYLNRVPLLQGALYEYEAQLSLFVPGEGACYRCVFREPPAQNALAPCAEIGVLGVVPGTAGLMMATEAIKYLCGMPVAIQGTLLVYNALTQTLRHIALSADQDCPLCGLSPTILEARETPVSCRPNTPEASATEVSQEQAEVLLSQGAMVIDVREAYEVATGQIPGALNLPLGALHHSFANLGIPNTKTMIVYCQKGQRSLEATRILKSLGYQACFSVKGGIAEWTGSLVIPV